MSVKKNTILLNQINQSIKLTDLSKDASNYPPENIDLFQNMVKYTNQNSPKASKSLLDCKSLLECSNTFSIKNENQIQDVGNSETCQNINTSSFEQSKDNIALLKEGNNIIVYNIGDEYLIPMSIIHITSDEPTLIKLQYLEDNSDIIVKKGDIFFQQIDSFVPNGNFATIKKVNELSLLKNIQFRMKNNQPFAFINNIMLLLFYDQLYNENKERDFFLDEFIKQKENEILIYKPILMKLDTRNISAEIHLLKKYLLINDYDFYRSTYHLLDTVLKLINVDMKYLISYHSNTEGQHFFTFLPIFNTKLGINDISQHSIFFTQKYTPKNDLTIEPISPSYLQILNNDIKEIFKNIVCTDKEVLKYINQIIEIMTVLHMEEKIQNIIELIVFAYILCYYKYISKNNKKEFENNKLLHQIKSFSLFMNNNNMIFLSNIIILIMMKYLNTLFNMKINSSNKNSNTNSKDRNCFIMLVNSLPNEDEIILSEILKKKEEYSLNYTKNDNSLSNFIKFYLNEHITNFQNKIAVNEKLFLDLMEKIFQFNFLVNNQKLKKKKNEILFLEIFKYLYTYSITEFEKIEKPAELRTIKQLWNFNSSVPNFNVFLTEQNKINNFFHNSLILDYIASYQKQKNTYFKSFSLEHFFEHFLPVLSDIDSEYRPEKVNDYVMKLKSFINELQNYQNIIEPYKIDAKMIKLSYNTYEILCLLLKSLMEEHLKIIQRKYLKRKHKFSLVFSLKQKAKIIQRAYRSHLYTSYQKKNNTELSEIIVNRYKGRDPLLIMLIINSKNAIKKLVKENTELKVKINSINTGTNNKKLKINGFLNNSSSNRSGKHYCESISSISNNNNSNTNRSQLHSNEEIKSLKEKLNDSRNKYKDLVQVIVEYEKKMQNFVKMINSNREVKEVMIKNGIQIK